MKFVNNYIVTEYGKNLKVKEIIYTNENRNRHRENGAAYIKYINGKLVQIRYYKNGNLHNDKGPAVIDFFQSVFRNRRRKNKKLIPQLISYYKDGKYHREDGPARTSYDSNGRMLFENYFVNGLYHRIGGPAVINYRGINVESETWYINGEKHRTDGPAVMRYGYFDYCNIYYINGNKIEEKTFKDITEKLISGKAIKNINRYSMYTIKLMLEIAKDREIKDFIEAAENRIMLERLNGGIV